MQRPDLYKTLVAGELYCLGGVRGRVRHPARLVPEQAGTLKKAETYDPCKARDQPRLTKANLQLRDSLSWVASVDRQGT